MTARNGDSDKTNNPNTSYSEDTYQRERPGRSPDEYDRAYPMGMASETRMGPDERMPADMRPGRGHNEYDQDPWRYEGGQVDHGQRGRPSQQVSPPRSAEGRRWDAPTRQGRRYEEYRAQNNRSDSGPRGAEPRQYHQPRERSFRGVGPRNYRRSDDRIREDLCDRLTDNASIDASDIDIRVSNGEVTLEGSVDSRRMKHLAEDIADDCPGVSDVHNRVKVANRRAASGRRSASPAESGNEEEEGHGSPNWDKNSPSESTRP